MRNNSGFTLIEVLVVVAIMIIAGSIILPVSADYRQRNDLDISQVSFAQSVRRAQQLSMSGDGDSQWGINAISGSVVIFKGNTYATRDANYDEKYDISSNITFGGQLEYDFAKVTGLPVQTGTATFTDGVYQKQVGINAKGIVNY
jgi:prepilin-type N-terminal cleavage/methylation domain-containing protein